MQASAVDNFILSLSKDEVVAPGAEGRSDPTPRRSGHAHVRVPVRIRWRSLTFHFTYQD